MRPWVIREYSQDTLPSVTAYLEVVPITDYVENMEVINIDNRILTGNTTFLDATQDIDFEFEIKNENLILDRHKTFSLSDIIGPWTDNTLFGFYRPLQLKYYNLSDIPTVRVHSEPEITYNPIVLANTEIVSFTTLYGNTAFADATHDVTFEYGFEDDTIIVDRNKTFAEDRVISRWVDTKFSLDMIPKIFVDFESETVPTAKKLIVFEMLLEVQTISTLPVGVPLGISSRASKVPQVESFLVEGKTVPLVPDVVLVPDTGPEKSFG